MCTPLIWKSLVVKGNFLKGEQLDLSWLGQGYFRQIIPNFLYGAKLRMRKTGCFTHPQLMFIATVKKVQKMNCVLKGSQSP